MVHIATFDYHDVKFVWITNHYDIHLNGLCSMGGTLFYFKTIDFESDNPRCEIYMLSFMEDVKWRIKKFLFEQMVGYHWTYPYRKQGAHFYYRKPEWLYKFLFTYYYKIKKLLK